MEMMTTTQIADELKTRGVAWQDYWGSDNTVSQPREVFEAKCARLEMNAARDRNGVIMDGDGPGASARLVECPSPHSGSADIVHAHGDFYACIGCRGTLHASTVRRLQSDVKHA